MKLTIAIPTFMRDGKLLDTISRVHASSLPFRNTNDISFLIVDNHQRRKDEVKLHDLICQRFGDSIDIRVVSNNVNIGASANILRLIENCDDGWVWFLGDDDMPGEDCIQIILDTAGSENAIFGAVKFDSDLYSKQSIDQQIFSSDELLSKEKLTIHYFSNLMFLSTWVFRVDCIRGGIADLYRYTGSYAPQLFAAFEVLRKNKSVLLSKRMLVKSTPGEWVGTIVHNYLYEHIRTSHYNLSTDSIRRLRKVIFFEKFLFICPGRVFRAQSVFGPHLSERIICGTDSVPRVSYIASKILISLLSIAVKFLPKKWNMLAAKAENGNLGRH